MRYHIVTANVSLTILLSLACVAGGIVCVRNNVLTSEPLKASGEAARRMGKNHKMGLHV